MRRLKTLTMILSILMLMANGLSQTMAAEKITAGTFTLSVTEGAVTLDANEAKVSDVLEDLATKSDLQVKLMGQIETVISDSFENMPMEESLSRILKSTNWASRIEENKDARGHIIKNLAIFPKSNQKDDAGKGNKNAMLANASASPGSIQKSVSLSTINVPQPLKYATIKRKNSQVAYVANELLVRFMPIVKPEEIEAINKRNGASVIRKVERLNTYRLRFPEGVNLEEVARVYKDSKLTETLEPNYTVKALSITPNDGSYANQWSLAKTMIPEAWDITTGATSTVVAVLDTGVNFAHPEFNNRVIGGYNVLTGIEEIPIDDHGHGTAVTGIIAATGNNATGIAGVDWSCKIMPVKFIASDGTGTYLDLIEALLYAADHGAQIINMSFGSSASSEFLQEAIQYAHDQNIVLIAAAGNEGIDAPVYPAAFANVLGVAATDHNDEHWTEGNIGGHIDLAAPGVSILTTTGEGYGYETGTSSSTALVTGVASLIKAKNTNLTNSQIESQLKISSDDLGEPGTDNLFGAGRVNAFAAFSSDIAMVHDLAVTGIELSPYQFTAGESTNVIFKIRNEGNFTEENIILDASVNGIAIGGSITIPSIAAGKSYDLSLPWTPPALVNGADFLIKIVVTPVAQEEDITDNTLMKTFEGQEVLGVVTIMHKSEPWAQPHQFFAGEAANYWPSWDGDTHSVTVTLNSIAISKEYDGLLNDDDVFFKVYINDQYRLCDNDGNFYKVDIDLNPRVSLIDIEKTFTVDIKDIDSLIISIIAVEDEPFGDLTNAAQDQDLNLHGRLFKVFSKEETWGEGTQVLGGSEHGVNPADPEHFITANIEIGVSSKTGTASEAQKEIWSYIGTRMAYDTYDLGNDPNDANDPDHVRQWVYTYSGSNTPAQVIKEFNGSYKVPYYYTVPYSELELNEYFSYEVEAIPIDRDWNVHTAGTMNTPGNNVIEGTMEEDLFNVDNVFDKFADYFYNGQQMGVLKYTSADLDATAIFFNHFWVRSTHTSTDDYGLTDAVTRDIVGRSNIWPFDHPDEKSAYQKAEYYWKNYVLPNYISDNKGLAYYYLGRVVHLLEDMTVPAHALGDPHPSQEDYEDYVGKNFAKHSKINAVTNKEELIHLDEGGELKYTYEKYQYDIGDINYRDLNEVNSFITDTSFDGLNDKSRGTGAVWSDEDSWNEKPDLFKLFWTIAEFTDNFDSNDRDGEIFDLRNDSEGIDEEYMEPLANVLVPHAMKAVAELYKLFWDTTHSITDIQVGGVSYTDGDTIKVLAGQSPVIEAWSNGAVGVKRTMIFVDLSDRTLFFPATFDADATHVKADESLWSSLTSPGIYDVAVRTYASGMDGELYVIDEDVLSIEVYINDQDKDGMDDDWETANGLDPSNPDDAGIDLDGDGLTNLQEFKAGTNPQMADTDGDGYIDGVDFKPNSLTVRTMPNGDTDEKAYTWVGNQLNLWGNVRTEAGKTYTYAWDANSDGTPECSGTFSDARNIYCDHAYNQAGLFEGKLTVTDNIGRLGESVVRIKVLPTVTKEARIQLAIERGLKWLYLRQNSSGQIYSYNYYSSWGAETSAAVLAFENRDHKPCTIDQDGDNDIDATDRLIWENTRIYAETVHRGLDAAISSLTALGVSTINDSNGNGVYVADNYYPQSSYRGPYKIGMYMMALVGAGDMSSGAPELVATTGPSGVIGKTYRQLVEDMVDYCDYAQLESGSTRGGWRYGPNQGPDNSACQWPAIGMEAAEYGWDIPVRQEIKDLNANWTAYSQYFTGYESSLAYGAFGYTGKGTGAALTGAGMCQLSFQGKTKDDPRILAAAERIGGYDKGTGSMYAMYAIAKAARIAKIDTNNDGRGDAYTELQLLGGWDWYEAYANDLLNRQRSDGSWYIDYHYTLNTAWAVEILTKNVFTLRPIADLQVTPNPTPALSAVDFDLSRSFHQDSIKLLDRWEIDVDDDGSSDLFGNFPNRTATLYQGYGDIGYDYSVTANLLVFDNIGDVGMDQVAITITSGNVAPVADPGGPYNGSVGENISFDGSASYDPNQGTGLPGDHIVSWNWDLDGDGQYDDATGEIVQWSWANPYQGVVGLKVTDDAGLSSTSQIHADYTEIFVVDLWPVAASYVKLSATRVNRYAYQYEYKFSLVNRGNAIARNVECTLETYPNQMIVVDGNVSFGDIVGGETKVSLDSFTYQEDRRYPMTDDQLKWRLEYDDATGHKVMLLELPLR